MDSKHTCQMTVVLDPIQRTYCPCGKAAKFRTPKPQMKVEYLCGTHARSVEKFYKRTNQNIVLEMLEVER